MADIQEKIWADGMPDTFEIAKLEVALGTSRCAHNRTVSMRNPNYCPHDHKQRCTSMATHVEVLRRIFVMGTYIFWLPLCDEHKGWSF